MTRITSDNIASLSPSDLLFSALEDLAKCEGDPNYRVDMRVWHRMNFGVCAVCLGGAVMAKSLGADIYDLLDLEDFNQDTRNAFEALDCFRTGDVCGGLVSLGYYVDIDGSRRLVNPYSEADSNPFFDSMMLIHAELLELGY